MLNKYVVTFINNTVTLISSETKVKAINTLIEQYSRLFETEDFRIQKIFIELNQDGNQITEEG